MGAGPKPDCPCSSILVDVALFHVGAGYLAIQELAVNSGDDRQRVPFQFSIMALLVLMVLVSVFFGLYKTFGQHWSGDRRAARVCRRYRAIVCGSSTFAARGKKNDVDGIVRPSTVTEPMMPNDEGTSCRPLVLLAIVIAAVMFVFPLFVPFPLMDPDEGLHASIAQEMVERGDWITPRFLGEPFFDKPILYFWIQAVSLRLFGPNEAAVRLPGLMFGLLGAVTTGLLAWRMFGRKTGWIAGMFYATTILPTALAQAASHDVALVPWVNLAILLLWESTYPAHAVCGSRHTASCRILRSPAPRRGTIPGAVDPDQGTPGRGRRRIGLRRLSVDHPASEAGGVAPRRGRSVDCRAGRRAVVSCRRIAATRFPSLLLPRPPRARLRHRHAAAQRPALVVLSADPARRRAAVDRLRAVGGSGER